MSPEEAIGKFVSFELMIKGSKKIIRLLHTRCATRCIQSNGGEERRVYVK
jgi:hypothetical protein